MIVSFYGHVRQYHNIQTEIDANIREVLESGQYVMGPALQRFEQEFADYHGMKHACGVGTGRTHSGWSSWRSASSPGDECITTANTFFATAEAIWIADATAVFVDSDPKTNASIRRKIEAAITPENQGARAGAPVRPVRRHEGHPRHRRQAQAFGHRRQRAGHRGHGDGFKHRRTQRRRLHELHHPEEPGHASATAAPSSPTATTSTAPIRKLRNHGSDKRSCHSMGYNSRLDDIHAAVLSVKLSTSTSGPTAGGSGPPATPRPEGRASLTLPYEPPGYRHVYHLYVMETRSRSSATRCWGFSIKTASTRSSTTRSPFTSRKAIRGASGADCRARPQLRAECRLLHLAADVPRTDR